MYIFSNFVFNKFFAKITKLQKKVNNILVNALSLYNFF